MQCNRAPWTHITVYCVKTKKWPPTRCLSFILAYFLMYRWWLSAWQAAPGSTGKRIFIFRAAALWARPRPCAVRNASHKQPAPPLTHRTPPPLNKTLSAKKLFSDRSPKKRLPSKLWRAFQAASVAATLCSAADVCRVINTPPAERWFIFTVWVQHRQTEMICVS